MVLYNTWFSLGCNVKDYISFGLRIKKTQRGLSFDESEWLKPYIELNTELRKKVTNDFEKDFFKLMNNSVFGKTVENIRNRVNIKLVSTKKKAEKLVAKPNFYYVTLLMRIYV